jgi:hypothetical protein
MADRCTHMCLWDEQVHVCACGMDRHACVHACGVNRRACVRACGVKQPRLGGKADGCQTYLFWRFLMCLCLRWMIENWIM